ncbi:hypothetical protein [uncultured Clostridium sp.]|uniref:hypothetical protein n=1 Tax=uncultured Clostridium sp. TaxID=59620 RepID=UPI002637038A|nr:hypothetical protein [uncultured Clostridium sp.]
MYRLIELIKAFKLSAPSAEIKEDKDKLTIDAKNYDIQESTVKEFLKFGIESIYLSADEQDLFNYIDTDCEFNEYRELIDENNYIIKLYINKRELISKNISINDQSNILMILTEQYYQDNIEKRLVDKEYKYILSPNNNYFKTESTLVTNFKRNFKDDIELFESNDIKVNKQRRIIENTCNWSGVSNTLIPDEIYVDFTDTQNMVDQKTKLLIKKITIITIIKSIANVTEEINGNIRCKVFSNKTIKIDATQIKDIYSDATYSDLYWLYKWIYNDSITDKITVARNVIGALIAAKRNTNCPNTDLDIILENTDWLKNSIIDNFDKIIRGNIEEYFTEKNNVMKLLKSDLKVISDSILEIVKSINTNMLAGIGALIAGSVGYIAKQDVTMIRVVALLYALYISSNAVLNLKLISFNKNNKSREFEKKKEKYISEYLEDNEIKDIDKEKQNSEGMYKLYFRIYIGVIFIIDFICIKATFSEGYILWIISLFK